MTLRYVKRGDVILPDDHNAVRQAFIDLCDTVKAKSPGAPDVQAKCDEIKAKASAMRTVTKDDYVLASDHNTKRGILLVDIPTLWGMISEYQAEFVDKRQELIDKASLIPERKYGDYVLAEDHNSVVSALELARTQAEQVKPPPPPIAVVSAFSDQLAIIDISDKANPVIIGHIISADLDGANDVELKDDDFAFVPTWYAYAFTALDIRDRTAPAIASTLYTKTWQMDGRVVGNTWFVGRRYYWFSIIDITDPFVMSLISETSLAFESTACLDVILPYAYLADSATDTFFIIDVSDLTAPVVVGSITATSLDECAGVEVVDIYAYVTAQIADMLNIIDVSDPTAPTIIATLSGAGGRKAMDVALPYVYTARDGRLAIVDVSDPYNPFIVTTLEDDRIGFENHGLVYAKDYIYCVGRPYNFTIIDVANKEAPQIVGHLSDDRIDFPTGLRLFP